jgi:putative transposase
VSVRGKTSHRQDVLLAFFLQCSCLHKHVLIAQPWATVIQPLSGLCKGALISMAHSYSVAFLHLVFSTKMRVPYLADGAIRNEAHLYMGGISRGLGCEPLITGGAEDHIHILARLGRTIPIANWVKEIKRMSSIWISDRLPTSDAFAWQTGYGVFSVSKSNVETVRAYIANQEAHHRKQSYQDEMRALLAAHNESWDEHDIWH